MVNIGERVRKWKEMRARTGEWESLGFCPNCDVHMMGWAVLYDNGFGDIGRICPKCGYISPYFTDILSNLRARMLIREDHRGDALPSDVKKFSMVFKGV